MDVFYVLDLRDKCCYCLTVRLVNLLPSPVSPFTLTNPQLKKAAPPTPFLPPLLSLRPQSPKFNCLFYHQI